MAAGSPPSPANSLRSDSAGGRRRRVGVLSALFVAAVVLLFFFDPATTGFYPPCVFKTIFGRSCPGCGSLRAMHQLLHGNFAAAWALNPILMIVGPLAAAVTLFTVLRNPKTP